MIHAALVSAYPTEAEARAGIVAELQPLTAGTPYLGVWRPPPPLDSLVHLFSADVTAEELAAAQWTQGDA